MRRVAAELQATPGALYAHVRDKAQLDDLMIGELCSRVTLPVPDPAHWRAQVIDVCGQLRDQYLRYPGISRAALEGTPHSLEAQRIYESLFAILLAAGVSPQSAAWVTDGVSWRWCLYVNLIIAVPAFVGALIWLSAGERPGRVRFDTAGTVTAVLGLVGIVYGLGNAGSKGWTDLWTLGAVIAGAVLVVVFVLIERRADHPLLPLGVILDRDRGAAYLSVGISGIGSFAVFLFLTYYLEDTLRFTPIQTGIAFLPMVCLLIIGAIVSGSAFMPRTGPRPLVPVGCLLAATGMVLLTGIGTASSYAGGVLPALLVIGFGFGLIFGPAQNAATSGVKSDEADAASAVVNTAQQIGGSIGTAVFSSLAASAIANYLHAHAATATQAPTLADATIAGYHLVFWIAAAVFLGTAVLAAILFRSGPLPVDADAAPVAAL